MTRCSCGAPLVREWARVSRLGGDLLAWCPCSAGCGSTTTVVVESCPHARFELTGERAECLDCGHVWVQLGRANWAELTARQGDLRALGA